MYKLIGLKKLKAHRATHLTLLGSAGKCDRDLNEINEEGGGRNTCCFRNQMPTGERTHVYIFMAHRSNPLHIHELDADFLIIPLKYELLSV